MLSKEGKRKELRRNGEQKNPKKICFGIERGRPNLDHVNETLLNVN